MSVFQPIVPQRAAIVGRVQSALLVTGDSSQGGPNATIRQLLRLGIRVTSRCYTPRMMADLTADLSQSDFLVMDCDGPSGLAAGLELFRQLPAAAPRLPVLLVTTDCLRQTFPANGEAPFLLRSPLSIVALRIALETAFPWRAQGLMIDTLG